MRSYRTRLPPLDTLVFFESALRCGSFTKAAEELLVSQVAVSKRIRQLEDWLEVELFSRDRQRLQATQAGLLLGERISSALDFLDHSFSKVRAPHDPVVRIASMAAIGMFWLQPRLRAFSFSDFACPYSLTLSDKTRDFFSGDFDLVLIYGDGMLPGWITHMLIDEELVPVASPAVVRALKGGNAGPPPLLDYRRHSPEWINWDVWRQYRHDPMVADLAVKPCSSYAQSIGLALEGKGVALGSLPMLEHEIASGSLRRLPVEPVRTGRAYWLARREGPVAHKGVMDAWRALTKQEGNVEGG